MLFYPEVFVIGPLSGSLAVNQSASTNGSVSSAPSASLALPSPPPSQLDEPVIEPQLDEFGITKIYPTRDGGREWFINMSYPKDSPNFSITDNANLTKVSDGAWRINSSHVRMVVNTSDDQSEWMNTEMTGLVRLSLPLNDSQSNLARGTPNSSSDIPISLDSPENEESDDLVFISRSGRHSSDVPCEGTAYNGDLHVDGSVGWKKEIWHTGGYTGTR